MKYKQKDIDRFWSKVNKTDYCWNWKGSLFHFGYGEFWFNNKNITAHKFSYEIHKGKIPDGLEIDHLCRNPACVNPLHLEAVTSKENTLRGESLQAINSRKTHCIRGHPLSGDNLIKIKAGRSCKACVILRNRLYKLGMKITDFEYNDKFLLAIIQ